MGIKKSDKASLDNRRTTGFLLGLIFVLSLCYVGLEFTSHADDANSSSESFDDMSEDIEMLPAMDTHDMIAAAPVAAAETAAASAGTAALVSELSAKLNLHLGHLIA